MPTGLTLTPPGACQDLPPSPPDLTPETMASGPADAASQLDHERRLASESASILTIPNALGGKPRVVVGLVILEDPHLLHNPKRAQFSPPWN